MGAIVTIITDLWSKREKVKKIKVQKYKKDEKPEISDNEVLHELFPLIVTSMKLSGLWPAKATPRRRKIFVFLNIFYIHGPMVVYAIKHRNNFLQASYAICEMGAGSIYYWRLLWCGILSHFYLGVIEDLVKAWKNAIQSNVPEWSKNKKQISQNSFRFSAFLIGYFVIAGLKYSVITVAIQLFRVYVLHKDERIDFGYHIE